MQKKCDDIVRAFMKWAIDVIYWRNITHGVNIVTDITFPVRYNDMKIAFGLENKFFICNLFWRATYSVLYTANWQFKTTKFVVNVFHGQCLRNE